MENKYITPGMKVADLLETFPQLEDVLIEIAPVFKKLKNPVLKKTIAKVTTLEQAAAVGGLKIDTLINRLREEAGQEEIHDVYDREDYIIAPPAWFNKDRISKIFDAVDVIRAGGHPLGDVMRDIAVLKNGEIYEFHTPFLPAPLIDKVKEQGFHVWTEKRGEDLFINYIYKG
jgi:hypothetical protein